MGRASSYKDRDELARLYRDEHLSTYQIAKQFDVTPRTILDWLERHGIDRRKPCHERPPCLVSTKEGYERWEHEHDGDQWHVSVHRLLAVAEYGFDAVCDNDVHHRNHVPWDNRPSNVEPLDHGEHGKYHANNQ